MDDETRPELLHAPKGNALLAGSSRASLIARGRREAEKSTSNADYVEAVRCYRAGDFAAAARSFRLAAEAGHAEAQYMLSAMCDAGEGVPRDEQQAQSWERRAAEQGHAYAQANLSFRHYEAEEYTKAFEWCMRAAHSKLAWAQFHVGLMYRKGEGVARSDAEAARWYRLAAEQDHAEAQQKLGDLCTFGHGVRRDLKEAAAWYRRAAEQGNAEAQFQLGHLYATGEGVESDYVQSRHWIRQAALQGHAQAVRELQRRQYRDP